MQFDTAQVQQLITLIESSGWDHARIETDTLSLLLSKGSAAEAGAVFGARAAAPPASASAPASTAAASTALPAPIPPSAPVSMDAPAAASPPAASTAPPGAALVTVDAPTVGTFYQAPKPDAPPFVVPGDRVEPDTTVCILEVMKLMNHVRAGVTGTVVEVFARNNELVEHGQPLMSVALDPAPTGAAADPAS